MSIDCPYDPRVCQQEFRSLHHSLEMHTQKMDAMSMKLDRVLSIEGPIATLQKTMAEAAAELRSVESRIDELRFADESMRDDIRQEARSAGGKTGGAVGAGIAAAVALLWKILESVGVFK